MHSRFLRLILALALVLGMVSGCTPQPAPSPSPTSFATEEEAFAAAEETYRAYVDALNAVDLSDPETFEGVYAWTTGEANAAVKKTYSQMHADGWRIEGASQATLVELVAPYALADSRLELSVCLDVSAIDVVDRQGVSVVSPDRNQVQPLLISLLPATSNSGFLIADVSGREGDPACPGG